MTIFEPAALNEIGARANNEDFIYPSKGLANDNDDLYLVCDGVGGQDKGEVASRLICSYFPQYFQNHQVDIRNRNYLEAALQYVESHLKEHIANHPECTGMASTLTLLYLNTDKALIGWIGDSRIYHIRDGEILFQTKDHSEIQSLIDMGEISPDEAKDHPRKNVITRAISGPKETRIDQQVIEDIKPDDFFLLCTDGILENLNSDKIKLWFKTDHTADDIRSFILEESTGNTKDNYSMYLIKIKGSAEHSTSRSSLFKRMGNLLNNG